MVRCSQSGGDQLGSGSVAHSDSDSDVEVGVEVESMQRSGTAAADPLGAVCNAIGGECCDEEGSMSVVWGSEPARAVV